MAEHDLKVWPKFYDDVLYRRKRFEVRKNDRNYQVGDILRLRRFDPDKNDYTGGECLRLVTYMMLGGQFGIDPEYVVMSLD